MGFLPEELGFVVGDSAARTSPPLEVLVLFTDITSTLSALRTATQLAQGLTTRIRLLLIETVPYPLQLEEPQRNLRFLGRQFQMLVDSCSVEAASRLVETTAEIVLCRDAWEGLQTKLRRNSVVVIGTRSLLGRHAEVRLARKLRAAGHHVIRISRSPAFCFFRFTTKGLTHA